MNMRRKSEKNRPQTPAPKTRQNHSRLSSKSVPVAPGGGAENAAKPPETSKTTPKPDGGTTTEPKTPTPPIGPIPPVVHETRKPKGGSPVAPPTKPASDIGNGTGPHAACRRARTARAALVERAGAVLLSGNPANDWTRVAANQMLIPQHVLALPTFRPKIGLTSGVTVEMLGGTRVELLGSSPKELSGIRVLFGRVVLMPIGKGGTRLRVEFGDHHGTITFVDAESVAAIEVHHLHAPGTNPESEPARVTADLFASRRRDLVGGDGRRQAREAATAGAFRTAGLRRARCRRRRSPARNCPSGSRPTGRSRSR